MLAILQLGDIHVRDGRANPALERAQLIAAAVRTLVAPASELYLILAGDIAFSGKNAEYKLAEVFVRGLQQELKKLSPQYRGTATIPGNHDCNFDEGGDLREPTVAGVAAKLATIEPDGKAAAESVRNIQPILQHTRLLQRIT